MSTQSGHDGKQDPVEETAQRGSGDSQTAGTETTYPKSSPSVFVNSEPVREEQVQNAVKFLSHPKVQGSTVIYRRSFLEKKGLTKEEDSPPSARTSTITQEAAAPSGVMASAGPANRYGFHWYHALLAIGFLAGTGAGTVIFFQGIIYLNQKSVIPRLRSWVRSVVLREEIDVSKDTHSWPSLAEETADIAHASEEMLNSKLQEKKFLGEIMNLLDVQLCEIKSVGVTVKNLRGMNNLSSGTTVQVTFLNNCCNIFSPHILNNYLLFVVVGRSSIPRASLEPSAAPHPRSYMEIMAMVQRGERPQNIKGIDDSRPYPNQPIFNPSLNPRMKPWEVGQNQRSSNQVLPYQINWGVQNNGFVSKSQGDKSVPWLQPANNLRFTELENGSQRTGSYDQFTKRSWVPPTTTFPCGHARGS
ncbi:hypothetical protein SAY86_021153 [Trapa natans]|uniref:Peroxisomal membrane protein PEX14 n=1 Tax=Trapa natans TaxID=22666 RepID=A0AAN7MAK1_TRANT|nr:hypothetical protein SAY86_021153 [Trapa natans]